MYAFLNIDPRVMLLIEDGFEVEEGDSLFLIISLEDSITDNVSRVLELTALDEDGKSL